MMESLIVIAVIAASIVYAVWRIRCIIKAKNSPCHDCPGCELKEQMLKKEGNTCYEDKKSCKNFAR